MVYFIKLIKDLKKINLLGCWDGDPNKRPKVQEVVITLKSMMSEALNSVKLESNLEKNSKKLGSNSEKNSKKKSEKLESNLEEESFRQQIIRQFKLNYGLFLDGYRIKHSRQAVFSEDGVF